MPLPLPRCPAGTLGAGRHQKHEADRKKRLDKEGAIAAWIRLDRSAGRYPWLKLSWPPGGGQAYLT